MKYIFRDGTVFEYSYDDTIRMDEYQLKEGEHWVSSKEEPVHHFVVNENGEITKGLGGWRPAENIEYESTNYAIQISNDIFNASSIDSAEEIIDALPIMTEGNYNGTKIIKNKDGQWQDDDENIYWDVAENATITKVAKFKKPKPWNTKENKTVNPQQEFRGENESNQDYRADFYKEINSYGITVTQKDADDIFDAISGYTSAGYLELYHYEKTGVEAFGGKEMYFQLNKGIDLLPKYKGVMYRGAHISEEQAKGMKIGDVIKLDGVSSFTTQQSVAQEFADIERDGIPAVFETNDGIHRATSISKYSSVSSGEYEVLAHSEATYTIKNMRMENGHMVIKLEEHYA